MCHLDRREIGQIPVKVPPNRPVTARWDNYD